MSQKVINESDEEKGMDVTQTSEAPLLEYSKNNVVPTINHETSSDVLNKKELAVKRKSVAIIESNNQNKEPKTKLVPPDGGWGWVILFGATLVNVLVPGMIKSFGVLFVDFIEVFEATTTTAMWIPSLCYFLYSSLGPISSILSLKYSYRTVTLMGGTAAVLGMCSTFFANKVWHLYVTVGILLGIGAGLSFPPTVYIVTSYFVKLRGLANGVCISGSALGSVILPPLIRVILEEFGYRGATLIIGGLMMNVWVAALFYDPVSMHKKRVLIEDLETELESETGPAPEPSISDPDVPGPSHKTFLISNEGSTVSSIQVPSNESFIEDIEYLPPSQFTRSPSISAMKGSKPAHRERHISITAGKIPAIRSSITYKPGPPKRNQSTSSFQYITTPYHGSTLTLQPEMFASSFSLRGSKKLPPDRTATQKLKKKFIDFTLLKDPLYLIMLLSNGINAISYTNFMILLPSYALFVDLNKTQGALLLSIVSIFDLFGRIGGSALSDKMFCNKLVYYIGGLLVSGISLAVLPFSKSFMYIAICCSAFGISSGSYTGVTAVIMTDMLGEERLQSTYGISLFVNGILQFLSPPLCGVWLEYSHHSYVSLLCTMGIFLALGGAIWICLPFINKNRTQKSKSGPVDL